jgi:hypothetical protein
MINFETLLSSSTPAERIDPLPILHAALPIWRRGQLVGLVANGEVFTVGWVEPRERSVLRALTIAAQESPSFTPDQQFSFAAYYLLPEERWVDLAWMPDELIASTTGLPVDLVEHRRSLLSLGLSCPTDQIVGVCA